MTDYLVYRTGSNAANQPCTFEAVPIAIVRAASRAAACETTWGDVKPCAQCCPTLAAEVIADCGNLDVWPNQTLHAVPESRAKLSDWNAVLEQDTLRPSEGLLAAMEAAWQRQVDEENREYYQSRRAAGLP